VDSSAVWPDNVVLATLSCSIGDNVPISKPNDPGDKLGSGRLTNDHCFHASTSGGDMSAESQIRLGIYSHLAAAMVCEAFTLADRGLLISHEISRASYGPLTIMMFPAFCCCLVCPLVVIAGVIKIHKRHNAVIIAVVSETIVFWMWFEALAPSVSEYSP